MIRQLPMTSADYRRGSRRRLPRFLFDYYTGGAGREQTMAANVAGWKAIRLRQRVLIDVEGIDTTARLAGEDCTMPLALAPIGLAGMAARRGEVQAVRAADASGIPFTLSTVGLCGLDEVAAAASNGLWFQLYMIRDRGVVEAVLERAWAIGIRKLLFTVDLPLPGPRHRDPRNGMAVAGLHSKLIKAGQVLARPGWLWNVALRGGPMCLGTMNPHVAAASDPDSFRRWIDTQFDPGVTWKGIEWLRGKWSGELLLKGILDEGDARAAVDSGVDGIVISNHGGRQLDGVAATASKLPGIAQAVGDRTEVLVDGGIRGGIDLFRALALGADGALIGRPWIWALAAAGRPGLERLLAGFQEELRLAMALTGSKRIADIGPDCADQEMEPQISPINTDYGTP